MFGRSTRKTRIPSNRALFVYLRRMWHHKVIEGLDVVFTPLMFKFVTGLENGSLAWLRFVPPRPRILTRWARVPQWAPFTKETPASIRSYAGILRDPEEEERSYQERPLQEWLRVHAEAVMWSFSHSATFLIPTYPGLRRAYKNEAKANALKPASAKKELPPAEISKLIRAEAQRLGLSEVGFAKIDPKYTFAGQELEPNHPSVIVCIAEQDWAASQSMPSARGERAAFRSYNYLHTRQARLAKYIKSLGYDAQSRELGEGALSIHYGVEAGLGQLGRNGQMLTPYAGSRARLGLVTTNAPVEYGKPVDFGVPVLCENCLVCVRRCPPGAIPKKLTIKRGITKAPIRPERCYPVVSTTNGCAICMKVCPVQRYGLAAVQDHFVETGTILGKGTDELEGFMWPHDGRFYGAGEKPRLTAAVTNPPGWFLDPNRVEPLDPDAPLYAAKPNPMPVPTEH